MTPALSHAATQHRPVQSQRRAASRVWMLYFGSTGVATALVPPLVINSDVTYTQGLLAVLLLAACLYPTARYFARRERNLPVLPVLCLSYAIQFSLPIVTSRPAIQVVGGLSYQKDENVVAALGLALAGVLFLFL